MRTASETGSPAHGVTTGRGARYVRAGAEAARWQQSTTTTGRRRRSSTRSGRTLALLSVEELDERIALLKDEIARLEQAMAKKRASRTVADQFFKK